MTADFVTQHPIIDAVNAWLLEKYCLIYTKNFKLYMEPFEDNDGTDYAMGVEVGNFDRPIVIGGQFDTDQEFIDYYEKEFAAKQLWRIPLFSAAKQQLDELDYIFPTEDIPVAELVDNRQIRQIQNEHNL